MGDKPTNIRVVCRFRPLNELEKSLKGRVCVEIFESKTVQVTQEGEEKPISFTFDHIFNENTRQQEVFDLVAKPALSRVMEGYNATILAYGQTSSGKTFTMEGRSLDDEFTKGMIPRIMDELFDVFALASSDMEFGVKCSFLEIYNEKIQDLLDTSKQNLAIKEDKNRGIYVQDATEIYVNSGEEMRKVMRIGAQNRTIAATRMNEGSSRSHSIFGICLSQKNIETGEMKQSKLTFVDLAGSEKLNKTGAKGQQLEEAKNINKSLTTLGMVINTLAEGKANSFVPYRDSKLTRILQESIGGNSLTTLLLAASMCNYNDKETISTLRFGSRAKAIKNQPVQNVERSAKELQNLLTIAEEKLKKQETLINSLTSQIETGGFIAQKGQGNSEKNVAGNNGKPGEEGNNNQAMHILKQQIQISNQNNELVKIKENVSRLELALRNKEGDIEGLKDSVNSLRKEKSELMSQLNGLQLQKEKIEFDHSLFMINFRKILSEAQLLKMEMEITWDLNDPSSVPEQSNIIFLLHRVGTGFIWEKQ